MGVTIPILRQVLPFFSHFLLSLPPMMSYSVSLLLLLLPFTQALVPPPMLGACLLHQAAFQGDPQPSDNLVCELADAHCDDYSLTAEQWLNTFMVATKELCARKLLLPRLSSSS